jgi:hypothetical protein
MRRLNTFSSPQENIFKMRKVPGKKESEGLN